MINHTEGDVLSMFDLGEVDAILHCCNCQGRMGSGIAGNIRERYTDAWNSYERMHQQGRLKLGTISSGFQENREGGDRPGLIINLHAQLRTGRDQRQVNYEALYCALELARELIVDQKITSIGVPYKMACDRAGGNWEIVETMLTVIFADLDVTVVHFFEPAPEGKPEVPPTDG